MTKDVYHMGMGYMESYGNGIYGIFCSSKIRGGLLSSLLFFLQRRLIAEGFTPLPSYDGIQINAGDGNGNGYDLHILKIPHS